MRARSGDSRLTIWFAQICRDAAEAARLRQCFANAGVEGSQASLLGALDLIRCRRFRDHTGADTKADNPGEHQQQY